MASRTVLFFKFSTCSGMCDQEISWKRLMLIILKLFFFFQPANRRQCMHFCSSFFVAVFFIHRIFPTAAPIEIAP